MDYKKINQLLEKYWEGTTNLSEEQALKRYFQQTQIAQEHQTYAEFFQWTEEKEFLSDDFDQRLLEKLATPTVAKKRSLVFYLSRVAAVLLIAFGLWTAFPKMGFHTNDRVAEYSEAEIAEAKVAYQQLKEALILVSGKMNKGTDTAIKSVNRLDRATTKIRQK